MNFMISKNTLESKISSKILKITKGLSKYLKKNNLLWLFLIYKNCLRNSKINIDSISLISSFNDLFIKPGILRHLYLGKYSSSPKIYSLSPDKRIINIYGKLKNYSEKEWNEITVSYNALRLLITDGYFSKNSETKSINSNLIWMGTVSGNQSIYFTQNYIEKISIILKNPENKIPVDLLTKLFFLEEKNARFRFIKFINLFNIKFDEFKQLFY